MSPSATVIAQVVSALNARWNAKVAEVLPGHPLSQIDFGSESPNFFTGSIPDDQLLKSSATTLPALVLYSQGGRSGTAVSKSTKFDGPISIILSVYVTWDPDTIKQNFESQLDAAEHAWIDAIFNTAWAAPVYLTSNSRQSLSWTRYPISPAGSNWLQRGTFSVQLQYIC